jgi:AcrR family transcriptional regulator
MPPRSYDMSKRAAAVEGTRRRIVDATIELHTTQGILATSWEEIARRADVAPATVYRHFPTLDELLPACGRLGMDKLALPSDAEIAECFRGLRSRRQRLRRLVEELFAVYERGGDVLRAVRRERALLPPLQADHERIEQRLDALTAAALEPFALEQRDVAVIRALTDHDTWAALRGRGITGPAAVDVAAALLERWLRTTS